MMRPCYSLLVSPLVRRLFVTRSSLVVLPSPSNATMPCCCFLVVCVVRMRARACMF